MDEIFETEGDDLILTRSSTKKSSSAQDNKEQDIVALSASPKLDCKAQIVEANVSNTNEDDVFADSFANITNIDEILREQEEKALKENAGKNKTTETSCPKTPNLTVCNSEKLDLGTCTKESISKAGTTKFVIVNIDPLGRPTYIAFITLQDRNKTLLYKTVF